MTQPAPDAEAADTLPDAKPAFLKRVRIRGYKSIAFCDVALEPLTILVGRNASGKSNFLDALGFLRDLLDLGLSEAVSRRRGWRAILSRAQANQHLDILVEASIESADATWDSVYQIAIQPTLSAKARIFSERLTLTKRSSGDETGYLRTAETVRWFGMDHLPKGRPDDDPFLAGRSHQTETGRHLQKYAGHLLLGDLPWFPFTAFADSLRASQVYRFSVPEMRNHQPISVDPALLSDGSNLGRSVSWLQESQPRTAVLLGRYLSAIVPGVSGFRAIEYGDYETVRFAQKTGSTDGSQEFDASSMSDGTLRVLATLVAAFQVAPNGQEPGFIGIEEPETALHPAAMRALVDALDEATLRTQILLTTHSADLLDSPNVRPENIRVVGISDGKTVIEPVGEGSLEIVRKGLDTLGGLERQNHLHPNIWEGA